MNCFKEYKGTKKTSNRYAIKTSEISESMLSVCGMHKKASIQTFAYTHKFGTGANTLGPITVTCKNIYTPFHLQ